MDPKDLFNLGLTAASVAQSSGFHNTSEALQELALAIYNGLTARDRMLLPDSGLEILGIAAKTAKMAY